MAFNALVWVSLVILRTCWTALGVAAIDSSRNRGYSGDLFVNCIV